ncbi:BatA and WFA domain-containing protein [Bacillus sp. FJAT-49736]|uniref:vWA domain-containing protein n=1 Tax=Bacillus sp. FJAT-49736 TaxID=2833582 RepID=UPI001BC927B7|nr:BatA and WFA domain-containing protein [Bacillus sp. FJAT-49736]MBS4172336.1 VWA domain-containing protein [Bacillus sp. FJAT-49736]
MGIMNPIYLILSLFIIAVIVFYLFRKQYKSTIIPSNLFWEQVMNEWQASPWIDKLQRNLLLLLQLLILFCLMLSLIKPFWLVKGVEGDHIIFIVDTSASMSAQEDGITRFDQAKQEMNDIVNKLTGQDVTIITAGNTPVVTLKKEDSKSIIKSRLKKLQLSYQSDNLEKAIHMAESLAKNNNTSIHIYSDSVKKKEISNFASSIPIQVHNIGQSGTNVSLQSFGVAERNGKLIGIAVIENQGNKKQSFHLKIRFEKEELSKQRVAIGANSQKIIQIPSLPKRDYYTANITAKDNYPVDNVRTAVFSPTYNKIYAIGEVNPFIIKGFETVGVNVIQLSEKDWEKESKDGIILTESIPTEKWHTSLPIFAVNPNKENHVLVQKEIETKNDSLLQYVNFSKTYVKSAASINPSKTMDIIAQSGSVPLLEKGEINGVRVIALNFRIEDTDWPLHPGFPIFLYQSYQWLSEKRNFQGFFQPGERKWMNTDTEAEWKMFDANGKYIRSFQLQKESFIAPNKPGLYEILSNKKSKYLTVLLNDSENNIEVSPSFAINQTKLKASKQSHVQSFSNTWYWFATAALLLLFIEWEVYRRGNRY